MYSMYILYNVSIDIVVDRVPPGTEETCLAAIINFNLRA